MKSVIALYREVLGVFPASGRRFLNVYSWLLASLAVFDALALVLLALVIGPLAAGQAVVLPVFGELDTAGIVWAIVGICGLMVAKSVFATAVTWWATRRIPRYEVELGDRMLRAYLGAPWRDRLRKNSIEVMRLSDSGVDVTINSFVLPGATLLGEAVNLTVAIATLAIVEPAIAGVTFVYMLLLGAALYLGIARAARIAGKVAWDNSLRAWYLIPEIIAAMKEVTLQNKETQVAGVVKHYRTHAARARGNTYFLGQAPRFVVDIGLVIGLIVIGGAGFLLGGLEQAVSAVALFVFAGYRVAPSVIRFQSVVSQMISVQDNTRRVVTELTEVEQRSGEVAAREVEPLPEAPERIALEQVTFHYDPDARAAVRDVTLEIPTGSTVAFVGESGSGKSTMVDLLLTLLEPTDGVIAVDGVPLTAARTQWRSRVGYVPQEVSIFDATIAQNVALTWGDDFDENRVWRALELAQLKEFVEGRDGGLHASVGERGLSLSGGQRQRLGIARALYAEPIVLVLDEATSALDTQTEAQVTAAINALPGEITKVIVAHRLATIMDADRIFLMRDGEVVRDGTFAELVAGDEQFARQASLAGLA